MFVLDVAGRFFAVAFDPAADTFSHVDVEADLGEVDDCLRDDDDAAASDGSAHDVVVLEAIDAVDFAAADFFEVACDSVSSLASSLSERSLLRSFALLC